MSVDTIDLRLAMGFFWLGAGLIVLWGALLIYSLKKSKIKRK